jgi:propanediol utilization protein
MAYKIKPGATTCDCSRDNDYFLPDEEALVDIIYHEVQKVLGAGQAEQPQNGSHPRIPVGVSNRHIHLTEATFAHLFGAGIPFEVLRELYQAGEFASKHVLTIVGPKMRAIPNVRILGPLRKIDQVEVSLTDSFYLGIDAPVQHSGNIKGAAPLTLIGPRGSIYLEECAIIAGRHIHMTDADAAQFGVNSGDICKVRLGGVKSTVFENVLIRTADTWRLQMHMDTDDANAANIRGEAYAEFIGKMEAPDAIR